MADMTPTRLKRISKVPNRFSSEQSRIKITSSPGETIIDYNSNTVSTTRNVTPANKPIKLKTPTNEPFKIKLPIKRPFDNVSKDSSLSKGSNPKHKNIKSSSQSISSYSKTKSDNSKPTSNTSSGPTIKLLSKSSNQIDKEAKFTEPKTVTDNNVFPTPPSSQNSPNFSSNGSPTNANPICISQAKVHPNNPISERSKISPSSYAHPGSISCPTTLMDGSTTQEPTSKSVPESIPVATDDNCIRCPCGVNDDLGVMVECEKCHFWQHGHCINIANEEDAFDGYLCPFCVLPKDRAQESLQMLNHSDQYRTRFDTLEVQIENGSTLSNDLSSQFTLKELYHAAMDINRVVRSLIAKWKLYQTPYISDIRIYQNPIWGHDADKSPREKSNLYFVDNCKANLKTNIMTIAGKLETRVALLEHQFSPLEKKGQSDENQALIDKINRTIRHFRYEIATIRASLPELQSNQ